MRRSISILALLVWCGVALAAAPAAPAPPASVPRSLDIPEGALVAPGKAPELDLLYTGDVMGYIDPCG
jgi:hypothetical protein